MIEVRGKSRFKLHRYRSEKMRGLERRTEMLEAERRRLELLLGEACRYAGYHTGCSPWTLLDVFAETHRTNLARPAWIEERDQANFASLLHGLEDSYIAAVA